MFGQFFDIDESAFSIAPNPKYLYLSKQHEEALAHLVYGVTRKSGFVCLTGDIGTGKTTICRCMFEQLPENTDIAFVVNPKVSSLELLATICDELKLGSSAFQQIGIKEYVNKLHTYLIKVHAQGRNTVLIIDEAQNLSIDALEQIRALTNLETNEQKLLQIILIGQPELKTLLAKPELEQVNQRITARFHIGPLSLNETNHYINHRLLVAGSKKEIFTADNIKQIYKYTKGVPRRINILCDRVLLGAYTMRKNKISSQIIKQSAEEVFDVVPAHGSVVSKALAASVFALLISGVAVFAYQNYPIDLQPKQSLSSVLLENDSAVVLNADEEKAYTGDIKDTVKIDISAEGVKELELNPVVDVAKKQVIEKKTNYVAKLPNKQSKQASTVKNETVNTAILKTKSNIKSNTNLNAASTTNSKSANQQVLQFTSYGKAYQQLFRLWGISYSSSDVAPCEYAANNKLQCYQAKGDINNIISLNRPVLLKSKEVEVGPNYIVVVSIEGNHAVVNEKGDYQLVAISEVEANWSGEFEMLWRPLKLGVTNISPGQTGQAIALLDAKLAKFQGRESSASQPFVYSKDLVDQVRAFQIANKLPPDGVVGPITQIHFNNNESQLGEFNTPFLIK